MSGPTQGTQEHRTVNPVIDPALSAGGVLTFGNAAVERGLAAVPDSYLAVWSTFVRRIGTGWKLVGLERMPNSPRTATVTQ